MELDLPTGFSADPQAVAQCTIVEIGAQGCPASSRVGTLYLNDDESAGFGTVLPIYNVVPEHGYPAEFAIYHPELGKAVLIYASVRGSSDYGIHLSIPAVATAIQLHDVLAVIYGDPRGIDGSGDLQVPFMTNPSDCGQPLTAKLEADTYQEPNHWIKSQIPEKQPVANCDLLQFNPSISLTPSTTQADEPAGYAIDVHVPQDESVNLEGLATPDVLDVTQTLPAGLTITPGAADGLVGCPAEGVRKGSTSTAMRRGTARWHPRSGPRKRRRRCCRARCMGMCTSRPGMRWRGPGGMHGRRRAERDPVQTLPRTRRVRCRDQAARDRGRQPPDGTDHRDVQECAAAAGGRHQTRLQGRTKSTPR